MPREKLPDRRFSETSKLNIISANGTAQSILITVGFDRHGTAKEVFCADFKAGSDLHAIVMDACILVSRLLQYGDSAAEIAASMCEGPSMIGAIVAAIKDKRRDDEPELPLLIDPKPPSDQTAEMVAELAS